MAEKNSIARLITETLAKNTNFRRKGIRTKRFYFCAEFMGYYCEFVVTASNGHLFERDFAGKYRRWVKKHTNYPGQLSSQRTFQSSN